MRHYTTTSINAASDVRLHCGHDDGQWSVALDDTGDSRGINVYVHGTADELEQFGYAILRVAAGLRVEEVHP